jgi:hypothetical protein
MTEPQNQSPDSSPERNTVPPIPRQDQTVQPEENETHGMKRQPTLGQQISAHANCPDKGDVGRPGTNEEVFQGSKGKELQ